jgi:membrane-anchored glycerophosphoryl diester phosphodiesterase (GDPDase)
MYFFIVGFLFPKMKSVRVAVISIVICYLTETLQLYQADWIESIRDTMIGAVVLGFGFLWSDLLMYTFGGMTGYFLEKRLNNR